MTCSYTEKGCILCQGAGVQCFPYMEHMLLREVDSIVGENWMEFSGCNSLCECACRCMCALFSFKVRYRNGVSLVCKKPYHVALAHWPHVIKASLLLQVLSLEDSIIAMYSSCKVTHFFFMWVSYSMNKHVHEGIGQVHQYCPFTA